MKKIILLVALLAFVSHSFSKPINIVEMGAIGNGKSDNTEIIQKAIDQCSERKTSIVIPSGRYLISPLILKSHVHIHLEAGAVLLGNTEIDIYHKTFALQKGKIPPALIYGENIKDVSITGLGRIDGQGGHPNFQLGNDSESGIVRPIILYFRDSKDIKIQDISLENSAYWVQKYEACDGVMIRGVQVYSHSNFNNDGLDINGSKNVIISDCYIDTDDDALCFKSEVERYELCENITVTNCILRSNCSGIKFGTGSMSGFNNVSISNCVIYKASEENRRHWKQTQPWMGITQDTTVISGLALECVDGGVMNQITISNITMKDVQTPIFIRLGDRRRMFSDNVSVLKNINISNIIATSQSQLASSITGVPNASIENVSISNVQITSPGGTVNSDLIKTVPENIEGYPENRMFGNVLPAAAFYVRHVKNIRFDNINVNTVLPDSRPAFYVEDVLEGEFNRCKMNGNKVFPYKFKLTDRNNFRLDNTDFNINDWDLILD